VRAGLELTPEQKVFLGRFDRFQIQGRYPDAIPVELDVEAARQEVREAQEMFEWLEKQF